ncbi:hypothetical protein DOP62_14290 (plasmid) [Synechococcus elongatus PCC 11801]|uniref:Uncharacterized protein n=1 Tax=Synechococcus elongatus PCC 11801 TaxID=2219813 RepID=A0ACD5A3F4_SYNEL
MMSDEQRDRQTAALARRFEEQERQQQRAWPEYPTEGWEVELLKSRSWI